MPLAKSLLVYDWSKVLQVDYKGKQETFCPLPTDSVDSHAKRESVYPEKNYDELCKLAGSSVVSTRGPECSPHDRGSISLNAF